MIFLANRDGLRNKRVHRRIKNRFQSDSEWSAVRLRIASHREPGPYRVVAETDPRTFLDNATYPTGTARLEIGFDVEGVTDHDFYWFKWIEPERNLLLGWHQDDDHPAQGPVHLQVNEATKVVERRPATFIDKHPMAIVATRLDQLVDAIGAIQWQNESVTGLDW